MSWKSFFGPLVEPLGWIWLILLVTAVVLFFRKQRKAAAALMFPVLLLLLAGGTSLPEQILAQAEQIYPTRIDWSAPSSSFAGADAIVVLGGGYYPSDRDPYGFALSHAGTRLLAGLELARHARPKNLVIGGGGLLPGESGRAVPMLAQSWMESWAFPNLSITNLGVCADTHDEAVSFRRLQQQHEWRKVILVTSALHMRRSEAVFRKQGVEVIPAPCDYQSAGVRLRYLGASPFPRTERLLLLSLYVHEQVGWWVYRWRGWV
jgi:uncharacterized SAM-binding protein YcdF (DUF218 family)